MSEHEFTKPNDPGRITTPIEVEFSQQLPDLKRILQSCRNDKEEDKDGHVCPQEYDVDVREVRSSFALGLRGTVKP